MTCAAWKQQSLDMQKELQASRKITKDSGECWDPDASRMTLQLPHQPSQTTHAQSQRMIRRARLERAFRRIYQRVERAFRRISQRGYWRLPEEPRQATP
eukprot:CAMPEP_0117566660 /NCGR_PEP_ID=MMETSP0784-20121206/57205_1 /TAXON_ID=39447 /ORGANISM="" /LENGTH=98 /DNA_ID=CAMNT_0005364505 /DNA_START=455 /DNA_END=752 /DNA_ORIENTATION=+